MVLHCFIQEILIDSEMKLSPVHRYTEQVEDGRCKRFRLCNLIMIFFWLYFVYTFLCFYLYFGDTDYEIWLWYSFGQRRCQWWWLTLNIVFRRLDCYTTRVNIAQTWIIGITKEQRAVICHEKPPTHKFLGLFHGSQLCRAQYFATIPWDQSIPFLFFCIWGFLFQVLNYAAHDNLPPSCGTYLSITLPRWCRKK